MHSRPRPDPLANIVRALFGQYVSDRKIEELRRELIRRGLLWREEEHAPYEVGPPTSPVH
jgi:hypothetical protein